MSPSPLRHRPNPISTIRTDRILVIAVGLVALAGPVLPHAYNVAPIRAAALFAGARFRSPLAAVLVPLGAHALGTLAAALLRGDATIAFHELSFALYASFAACAAIGLTLRARGGTARIAVGTVAGSLLFFVVTNFAVWALLGTYPSTARGLLLCYAAGLPFLGNGLLGDLAWSGLFFAGAAWANRASGEPLVARG